MYEVTQEQFDALHKRAELVAKDIKADFPDFDVNFDLYVEKLGTAIVGVIDMGDAYQEAFELMTADAEAQREGGLPAWSWERSSEWPVAYEAIEAILKQRQAR
jgi:hypothetical protein